MLKERLLGALMLPKKTNNPDEETAKAKNKIQKQKRLSSQEFLEMYDTIWREGPKTTYQNPENWRRIGEAV